MFRILVVCTGNVCRSPMAEGILRSLLDRHDLAGRVDVRSAGTWGSAGAVASEHAVRVASWHGVKIDTHRSAALTPALIQDSDLILAMEPAHLEEILTRDPSAEGKAFVLTAFSDPVKGDPGGVEDPYGADLDAYEGTYLELDHLLRVAMPRILGRIEEAEQRSRSE